MIDFRKRFADLPQRSGFSVGGMRKRDWFSETELRALSISMVTRTERAMVIGWGSPKTAQVHSPSFIKGNFSGSTVHCMKWVSSQYDISGPSGAYKNHQLKLKVKSFEYIQTWPQLLITVKIDLNFKVFVVRKNFRIFYLEAITVATPT